MGRTRDFEKHPAQDYENRDFLYQGVMKAEDVRAVADYLFSAINHLKDPVYQEQIHKAAIERIQTLLDIYDHDEVEKVLLQELAEVSKKSK